LGAMRLLEDALDVSDLELPRVLELPRDLQLPHRFFWLVRPLNIFLREDFCELW